MLRVQVKSIAECELLKTEPLTLGFDADQSLPLLLIDIPLSLPLRQRYLVYELHIEKGVQLDFSLFDDVERVIQSCLLIEIVELYIIIDF